MEKAIPALEGDVYYLFQYRENMKSLKEGDWRHARYVLERVEDTVLLGFEKTYESPVVMILKVHWFDRKDASYVPNLERAMVKVLNGDTIEWMDTDEWFFMPLDKMEDT